MNFITTNVTLLTTDPSTNTESTGYNAKRMAQSFIYITLGECGNQIRKVAETNCHSRATLYV